MKVIRENKTKTSVRKISRTFQWMPETLELLAKAADKYEVPQQRLADAILNKALKSSDFTIDLSDK